MQGNCTKFAYFRQVIFYFNFLSFLICLYFKLLLLLLLLSLIVKYTDDRKGSFNSSFSI